LPARPRPARLPGDHAARPDRGGRRGHAARRLHRAHQPRRGPVLRGDRSAPEGADMTAGAQPQESGARQFLRQALASRSFMTGLVITLLIAGMAALSFLWTPYDVTDLVVSDRMKSPSATHFFGTDHLG